MENSNITSAVTQTINSLFNSFFSSVDNNLYSILDDLIFINEDILADTYFQQIFGTSSLDGILLIANAFVFGFLIYYSIKLFFSPYSSNQKQNPYQFIFKIFFLSFLMNFSLFFCEQLLMFNSYITLALRGIGESLFSVNISFSSLIQRFNTTLYFENSCLDIFSINGLMKSLISTSLFSLVISYSLRFVLIKVFILLLPFSLLSLSMPSTTFFFNSWLKTFLALLFIQIFVTLVLLIIFSTLTNSPTIFSKFLCCGGIFALIKANSYVKEFLGGITANITTGINSLKNYY